MTEYVLGPDEDQQDVARRLLDASDNPGAIQWSPRPNQHPHGGVYVLPDEDAEAIIAAVAGVRAENAARIEAALKAADERDAKADETGLTPEQLGLSASLGADPGAPGTETGEAQAGGVVADGTAEDAADEAIVDDPNTPEDEHADAENRVAKRRAARKATSTTDEQKAE